MKWTRWAAAAALLCLAAPAAGQDVTQCLKIDNELDRLACYDRVSGKTPKVTPLTGKGAWRVSQQTSKIDDSTNVFLHVLSDDPVDCGWNHNKKIELWVRCMENTTSLFLDTSCHMTDSLGYGTVTYRIDDRPAGKVEMGASTDNEALGLWNGGRAIPFIKELLGRQSILIRATPYGEGAFTATFPIAGLEEAVAPLRKACRW